MAPLTRLLVDLSTEYLARPTAYLTARDVSHGPLLDSHELLALMAVSLTTTAISILAVLFSFYWFVRMRRSFRHDLIMLLIQSDMMKAFWLVVCPIAFFVNSPIPSNSVFCQVSGFFLTASIEASDISVLLIAIHTSLFILRPQSPKGVSGLYPYRYYVYACWAVIPIILASVVPITGAKFEDNGPHCYLPLRPLWYRRALSWIPRYIIFGGIVVTYIILYLYVSFRYRRLGIAQRRVDEPQNGHHPLAWRHNHRRHRSSFALSLPLIADHGLLDLDEASLVKYGEAKTRQDSVPSSVGTLESGEETCTPGGFEHIQRTAIRWNPVVYDDSARPEARRQNQLTLGIPTSPSFPAVEIPVSPPEPALCRSPATSPQSEHGYFRWKRSISYGSHSIKNSVSDAIHALQQKQSRSKRSEGSSTVGSAYLSQQEFEDAVRQSREKMQRHLRLLFVYPVIYLLTWSVPFVAHIEQYNDEYSTSPTHLDNPPYGLLLTIIASLCIGAAVDCCFFSLWEKPWANTRGGFWESLALRLQIRRPRRCRGRGTGRTREERFMDAWTARVRREQENLENLSNEAATGARKDSYKLQGAAPRQWWDAVDVDGHEPGLG
ncbi:G protein-coupled glucose receptor regulating Gpa2-domain-containing protein [Hypoxylon sp. FL1150]|nr:G protein-coupled glucose receptor regulating Gpa2-domain-containing protein [Hypoxylon sp. FL1150]